MTILFIGDIVGKPGRNAVKALLPEIKQEFAIDLVLANGENLAAGLGMTYEKYQEMREAGIEYFTSGNHIFVKKEFLPHLDDDNVHVLRPANLAGTEPGRGMAIFIWQGKTIQLINLLGKAFMKLETTDYFDYMDNLLERTDADIRLVDFHAEATSEKAILGYYLDGKVAAVLGTHTHVPTADERVLPKGTAFQSDIGMTGPLNSSLGAKIAPFLEGMRYQTFAKYEVAPGPVVFNSTLLVIDDTTNKVTRIERIQRMYGA